jgi:hypothetical protein
MAPSSAGGVAVSGESDVFMGFLSYVGQPKTAHARTLLGAAEVTDLLRARRDSAMLPRALIGAEQAHGRRMARPRGRNSPIPRQLALVTNSVGRGRDGLGAGYSQPALATRAFGSGAGSWLDANRLALASELAFDEVEDRHLLGGRQAFHPLQNLVAFGVASQSFEQGTKSIARPSNSTASFQQRRPLVAGQCRQLSPAHFVVAPEQFADEIGALAPAPELHLRTSLAIYEDGKRRLVQNERGLEGIAALGLRTGHA